MTRWYCTACKVVTQRTDGTRASRCGCGVWRRQIPDEDVVHDDGDTVTFRVHRPVPLFEIIDASEREMTWCPPERRN